METWRCTKSRIAIETPPSAGCVGGGPRSPRTAGRRPLCHVGPDGTQVKSQFDRPEDWVPELAVMLDRYQRDQRASLVFTSRLLEMGLIDLSRPPTGPARSCSIRGALQQLFSMYGPKVTTASGYLGVSATKGEIWTPASETKGSSIWTPGSDVGSPSEGQKPRIIVTG